MQVSESYLLVASVHDDAYMSDYNLSVRTFLGTLPTAAKQPPRYRKCAAKAAVQIAASCDMEKPSTMATNKSVHQKIAYITGHSVE